MIKQVLSETIRRISCEENRVFPEGEGWGI
jgi:hypothetical protein